MKGAHETRVGTGIAGTGAGSQAYFVIADLCSQGIGHGTVDQSVLDQGRSPAVFAGKVRGHPAQQKTLAFSQTEFTGTQVVLKGIHDRFEYSS